MRPTRLLLTLTVAAALAASAAPAQGATTIGSNLVHDPNYNNCFVGNLTPFPSYCGLAISAVSPAGAASGGVTARISGVVTRWRVKSAGISTKTVPVSIALRTLSSTTSTGRTADVALPTAAAPVITSSQTRLSISAGERIGIALTGMLSSFDDVAPYITYSQPGAGTTDNFRSVDPDGTPQTFSPFPGDDDELLINADIEADNDHDGFGDETQDACPGNAAFQVACDLSAISKLKWTRTNGFSFSLSAAGSLDLLIERRLIGRRDSSGCSTNHRRGKRCAVFKRARKLTNIASRAGKATIPMSTKRLRPGKYRATISATNPTSGFVSTATTRFAIPKPKKKH